MFTDEHRRNVWDQIRQHDLRAFTGLLSPQLVVKAAAKAGINVGSGPLCVVNLTWLAVAAALHATRSFADVLTLTLKLLADTEGFASTPLGRKRQKAKVQMAQRAKPRKGPKGRSKHDPRRDDPTVVSEEAFSKARRRLPVGFWAALLALLGQRFEAAHGSRIRWRGLRLCALDGTSLPLGNWPALAEHFGTAKNGKERQTPHARMVMLQFPLARIPYRYELSPNTVGEKTLARRLIEHLEPKDLLLLDRGFWSYGIFWAIQKRGAFFGIRLFKSARLETVRRLGPRDLLVRYAPSDPRWRKEGLPAAIDLRVIPYQIPGFRPSAVVTNLLDARVASREDWVRLAVDSEPGRRLHPGLYHRRWEIETSFFELKISQGLKGALRSRTPESVAYEVAGHVLFYFLVRWLMVEAAAAHKQDPLRLSFSHALRELQDLSQTMLTASPQRVSQVLLPRLLARVAAHLVPQRPGRHYSRPHDTKTRVTGSGKRMLPSKLPTSTARSPKGARRAA